MEAAGERRSRRSKSSSPAPAPEDMISSLYVGLIHLIFSKLTGKELASIVSLVSKKWLSLVRSYQIVLDFNIREDEELFELVDRAAVDTIKAEDAPIRAQSKKDAPIRALRFKLDSKYHHQGAPDQLDNLMKSLTKHSFNELYLHSAYIYNHHFIVANSNFLSVLRLTSCILHNRNFASIPMLVSLQELVLNCVQVFDTENTFFHNLAIKCPSMVELTLKSCSGYRFIDFPDHENLKIINVEQYGNIGLISIRIGVTSLERLELSHYGSDGDQVEVDINNCKQLRFLHLHCNKFPSGFDTTNICSTFPQLETLRIYLKPPIPNTIRVVSDKLESLTIWNKDDLPVSSDIVTPNLRSFTYFGGGIDTVMAPMDAPKIVKARIDLCSLRTVDMNWFFMLKSYLAKLAKFSKVAVLYLSVETEMSEGLLQPHHIKDIGIIPCSYIKQLKLKISSSLEKMQFTSLINGLLWACHPQSLQLHFNFKFDFEQYLLEERNKQVLGHRCCWRHFLKDFKIDRSNEYVTFLFTW